MHKQKWIFEFLLDIKVFKFLTISRTWLKKRMNSTLVTVEMFLHRPYLEIIVFHKISNKSVSVVVGVYCIGNQRAENFT